MCIYRGMLGRYVAVEGLGKRLYGLGLGTLKPKMRKPF